MKRGIVLSALAALLMVSDAAVAGDANMRPIGAWFVSSSGDRFGDDGLYTAMMPMDANYILRIGCVRKKLTLRIEPRNTWIKERDVFGFRFRVDQRSVFSMLGEVRSSMIVIDDGEPDLRQLVAEIRGGKELGMQIEGAAISESVLRIDGADRALADIAQNCPLN